MKDAHRRTQVSEFVDVVLHAAGVENCVGHERGRHAADGQAIRLGDAVDMICRLSAAASRHMIGENRRVSRNVLLKKWEQCFTAQVAGAAGTDDLHHGDRFVLVKIGLGRSMAGQRYANQNCQRR